MPNWVYNVIEVSGNKKVIKDMFDFVTGKDEEGNDTFDFQKIVKMPEDLRIDAIADYRYKEILNITPEANVNKLTQEEFVLQARDEAKKIVDKTGKPLFESIDFELHEMSLGTSSIVDCLLKQVYNLRAYGFKDWYNWSNYNWGTKWNAIESHLDKENNYIYFETAWSCPNKILNVLSVIFPDITFEIYFGDEDYGGDNWGKYVLQNGDEEDVEITREEVYKKVCGEEFVDEYMKERNQEE